MLRSQLDDPRPVGTYVFGSTGIQLPGNTESDVVANCQMTEPLHIIAAFPHMHLLGTSLQFEAGPSSDDMQTRFTRDPYSFDDQHVEQVEIELQPGDQTRTTCRYENTTDHTVTFGESTENEMCFFIGFTLDRDGLGLCLGDKSGIKALIQRGPRALGGFNPGRSPASPDERSSRDRSTPR